MSLPFNLQNLICYPILLHDTEHNDEVRPHKPYHNVVYGVFQAHICVYDQRVNLKKQISLSLGDTCNSSLAVMVVTCYPVTVTQYGSW